MVKTVILVFVLLNSLLAFSANIPTIDLKKGEKVQLQVLGCDSHEQETIKLDPSTNLIQASCEKATCQALSIKNGMRQVYRFIGAQCGATECKGAEYVGEYEDTAPLFTVKRHEYTVKDMKQFLKSTDKCSSLRIFVGAVSGNWFSVTK